MDSRSARVNQCQKPAGWLGRLLLRNMNSRHSKVTDWGLSHISIQKNDTVLDVGCGGGRTVSKLAAIVSQGRVYGIDHSPESVAVASRTNKGWIDLARVEIREGSVSQLPFSQDLFDLVTAVETHFWWPNRATETQPKIFDILKKLLPSAIVADDLVSLPKTRAWETTDGFELYASTTELQWRNSAREITKPTVLGSSFPNQRFRAGRENVPRLSRGFGSCPAIAKLSGGDTMADKEPGCQTQTWRNQ